MVRCNFITIVVLALLQSCQSNTKVVEKVKKNSLGEAASYNTQLGLAYLEQGDRERAKNKLFLALEQAPQAPATLTAMAYFMEKSGDLANGELYYKKALSVAPGSGAQLNNYGAFLCRRAQYKLAESYFLQATLDLKYTHIAGAYENAGLCVMAIPDKNAALKYFAKALEQDPTRTQSLHELLMIYVQLDDIKQALVFLQKYDNLVINKVLLSLAIEIAQRSQAATLQDRYKLRLRELGETV